MTHQPAEPTGIQFSLRRGAVEAHIAQVGASLRGLSVGGVDLVPPYPLGRPSPAASGVVLVPWPNRIRDGVWTLAGAAQQLAITEPKTNNASHGLLRYTPYDVAIRTAAEIELTATVFPQQGYPFQLDTSVRYALADDGVRVTHTIKNTGADAAPVAVGTHPYVMVGGVDTDDLVLTAPAGTRFRVDDRLLPVAEEAVDGTDFDLRAGRRVGDIELDTGFGGVERDADGLARYTLTAPDGRRATLWAGAGFDFVQLFTTTRYPGQRKAVAIEPMTAPADAFNSGVGVRWLAPGETWSLEWGISLEI
ncbi:MAG: aldose 1-epimerase family protein [Microbacterium sp.]|uniref:aldose 1-epimerase family protein n=1 Tax=Microbacterium sp. TaxID=51671 RepID=UPI0039E6A4C3